MKSRFISLCLAIFTLFISTGITMAQEQRSNTKLFIGGGALPEEMYIEFLKLIGPDAQLVVIPTAGSGEPDKAEIIERWEARGLKKVSVLHTRDREEASSPGFADPLKEAAAIWFSGGSQHRIADVYLDTPVEEEVYKLIERGGIVGGSSAGAAIQTRVMIRGGDTIPKIATGFDLLPDAIVDQHFLKRNRLARLIEAIKLHPGLTGYGLDEGMAIMASDKELSFAGESYVLRVKSVEGKIKIDAFEAGDVISLADESKR